MELPSNQEVERLLNTLRGRVEPIVARRFACACVRRIWARVEAQRWVSPELMENCRRAVALIEQSLAEAVSDDDLRAVEFCQITDAGDEAFMAAAHVGWNLFAPLHGLHEIDEFDNASETAFLAACADGPDEACRQVQWLRDVVAEELAKPPLALRQTTGECP